MLGGVEATGHDREVQPRDAAGALARVGLIETITRRRSRRFPLGGRLEGAPFSYASRHEPVPLTEEEEAVLVFAAAGVTGFSFAELPFGPGPEPETGGGTIMVTPFGRTVASADGIGSVALALLNDDGAFLIRRPQNFPRGSIAELAELGRSGEFVELYRRSRVRLADGRPDIERRPPYVPPFNRWSTNRPGSTYFVPVSEATTLALTLLFFLLGEEMGFMLYDDRRGYRPAGLKRFARSSGGHLYDDPNHMRFGTVLDLESYVMELLGVEQGLMLQNLGLATEALGLGGFPHYGAQRYQWLEAMGFRMQPTPISELMRRGRIGTALMTRLGKNPSLAVPVGLEVDGEVLLKPYCPPYYPSMRAAVEAFVEAKYSPDFGVFRDAGAGSAWADPAAMLPQIPEYSDANVEAVVSYCEHVYERYGRFPGNFPPLRTLMAFSAHHIDLEFYDRYYRPGAYTDAHRDHFSNWH